MLAKQHSRCVCVCGRGGRVVSPLSFLICPLATILYELENTHTKQKKYFFWHIKKTSEPPSELSENAPDLTQEKEDSACCREQWSMCPLASKSCSLLLHRDPPSIDDGLSSLLHWWRELSKEALHDGLEAEATIVAERHNCVYCTQYVLQYVLCSQ